MSTTIYDVCVLRANELTRILAGCIAIDPVEILPMLDRLKDGIYTDTNARQFILAMRSKLSEFQALDIDAQTDLILKIVKRLKVMMDYISWLATIPGLDVKKEATEAIRELKKLAITIDTIGNLQVWYRENVEAYNERR